MHRKAVKRVENLKNIEKRTVRDFNAAFYSKKPEIDPETDEKNEESENATFDLENLDSQNKAYDTPLEPKEKLEKVKHQGNSIKSIINLISSDREKILIILLILLLSDSKDYTIIFALVYTIV